MAEEKPKGTPFNGHLARSIVRPVMTIGGSAVWAVFIWKKIDYPAEFQLIVMASWTAWFGERALKRIKEKGTNDEKP